MQVCHIVLSLTRSALPIINGGTIVAIGKKNCGHHPHGLEDNTPIIEFVERYSV